MFRRKSNSKLISLRRLQALRPDQHCVRIGATHGSPFVPNRVPSQIPDYCSPYGWDISILNDEETILSYLLKCNQKRAGQRLSSLSEINILARDLLAVFVSLT